MLKSSTLLQFLNGPRQPIHCDLALLQIVRNVPSDYLPDMKNAHLDRRVATQVQGKNVVQPLSHLRDQPYLVLLGEPGAGKSTALEYEAFVEGGEITTCREVMNGSPMCASGTAYLDALDEYRSGDRGKDKLLQLANSISRSNIRRWRLTCRAEDWRATADLKAMRRAANNEPITVAHLLPLNEEEAQLVLASLGETDPETFIGEARRKGADVFLENPLSLRLLHSVVVSNGVWPTSRFDLFARATFALAHEYDPERETDPRPGAEEVLASAAAMSFYLLASGAKALWRSNALPPASTQSEYVATHALGLAARALEAALDTALFRGEGQAFVPLHRTVAEFLAGSFLARRVVGASTTHAFPLRRAIALITGSDQKAPSELRGLYAWFAAHLHSEGDPGGARRLIRNDSATVLVYGDAAAFDTAGRKEILYCLDRDDPFFLSTQDGATVVGGLAGADLADDFKTVLDADVQSHLQVTVLQALAEGQPVEQMSEKLREIVLDTARPLWMRKRAVKILVSKASDKYRTQRHLLDGLANMTVDGDQLAVRAGILASGEMQDVQFADLHKLLMDFDCLPASSRDTRCNKIADALVSLGIAMAQSPRPDLLDQGVGRSDAARRHVAPVQAFLNRVIVAAIDADQDISAVRLLSWLENLRDCRWNRLGSDVIDAIGKWIDHDPNCRELEFFLALSEGCDSEEGPWVVAHEYTGIAKRPPSDTLIRGLLGLAQATSKGAVRKRLFQIAACAARAGAHWPELQAPILSLLEQERGFKRFIKSLLSDQNAKWAKSEEKRIANQDKEAKRIRKENIDRLMPVIDLLAKGATEHYSDLDWAAQLYMSSLLENGREPLEEIIEYTSEVIALAIAEGLIQFTIHARIEFSVEDLGAIEATKGTYRQEYVVAAGLHQALLQNRESDIVGCSPIIALIGLRKSYFSRDKDPSLADWAVGRLALDSKQGVGLILRYWNSLLDAGGDDLDAIDHLTNSDRPELLSRCMMGLLRERPGLQSRALEQAIRACADTLTKGELVELVKSALACEDLGRKQKYIWSFVGLALMPKEFANRLLESEIEAVLLAPNDDLAKVLDALCPNIDLLDRIRIEVLGKTHPARDEDWWRSGGSSTVRGSIRRLEASGSVEAGEYLKELAAKVDATWSTHLAHAAAEHARKQRDQNFVAPSVKQLLGSLANGPAATPADLAAIVIEEIERYKSTLRTGSETPWKRFWNTDSYGAATEPQIENEDRDRLLELFRPRFERYGISASLPEAPRGENTRVDILLLSHAGKNLPIEAKRHYNGELWTAPSTQLAGYAADPGASGFGIYLVFWFGTEFKVPKKSDGADSPENAEALEEMLTNDLPPRMKEKVTVVVLDVSRPQSMVEASDKRRKKI